jgi:hypothetical protein
MESFQWEGILSLTVLAADGQMPPEKIYKLFRPLSMTFQ